MKPTTLTLMALLPLLLLVGCIVGDQLTTLTIQPDGSADYVVFRSNLHSTQTGEKAEAELAQYKATFNARTDDECVRIRNAGGDIVETTWLREQAPFSNALHARFPDASALEKFYTIESDDGRTQITTQFQSDGDHRRLTIHVMLPEDQNKSPQPATADSEQFEQSLANGVSLTRLAVANGSITAARGFTIAGDKQSAVLNNTEIAELVHEGHGTAELFLEWDVTP